jgi:stalled ribosome rescue protein Dom34
MNKLTGIWIDKRTAKIVTLQKDSEALQEIRSSIEEFRPKGGSGTKLKGGPQDVIHDSKFTEREKQQQKRFFKSVMDVIADADQIVIFGPAEMGEKLNSELSESNGQLHKKVKAVKSADSMTDNQIKAWVREYYEN